MNWICDCCSSVNEERETECFVCGEPRSAAAVREAKRRAREEKLEARLRAMHTYLTITGRVLFVSSASVLSLAILVALVLKVRNGSMGDIVYAFIAVAKQAGENVSAAFAVQLVAALRCIPTAFVDMGKDIAAIWGKATENLRTDLGSLGTEIFQVRNGKFTHFAGTVVQVKDRIAAAFGYWWALLVALLPQCFATLGEIPQNVREIARKIKELITQL